LRGLNDSGRIEAMKRHIPPRLKKFSVSKQRRLDELLERNSEGIVTAGEKARLEQLVADAEQLMVANAQLLARFSQAETANIPPSAVPVTVWVKQEHVER
jgi:hypothetical protein